MARSVRRYVTNESPIWYLHRLGQLDLLPRLYGRITVPNQVVIDIARGIARGEDLPPADGLPWLDRFTPTRASLERVATSCPASNVHPGEREVIATALDLGARTVVLLDDLPARGCAANLGVRFTGTLGVLADAELAALAPHGTVRAAMPRLAALGFFISREVETEILDFVESHRKNPPAHYRRRMPAGL